MPCIHILLFFIRAWAASYRRSVPRLGFGARLKQRFSHMWPFIGVSSQGPSIDSAQYHSLLCSTPVGHQLFGLYIAPINHCESIPSLRPHAPPWAPCLQFCPRQLGPSQKGIEGDPWRFHKGISSSLGINGGPGIHRDSKKSSVISRSIPK